MRWILAVAVATIMIGMATPVYALQPEVKDQWVVRNERYIEKQRVATLSHLSAARAAARAAARRAAAEAAAEAAAAAAAAEAASEAPAPVVSDGINWDAIAECESGQNWSYNGPSGYDGGLQFLPSTWISAGGGQYAPYAYMATREQQIAVASTLSLSNWPGCQVYA